MPNLDDTIEYLLQNVDFTGTNIGLSGEMGSGKTYFARVLLNKLDSGFTPQIASPTYSYCIEYRAAAGIVNHFDLYRVENERKLWEIGFFESLEDENAITLVEWSNRFPRYHPNFDFLVKIRQQGSKRQYEIIHDRHTTKIPNSLTAIGCRSTADYAARNADEVIIPRHTS